MALNIRDTETEELAEAIAELTGESPAEAVTHALRERLEQLRKMRRLRRERIQRPPLDELDEIALHCARLPVLDSRTPEEILGYDEHGLPS